MKGSERFSNQTIRKSTRKTSPFRIISLFSGCGGLDLGFRQAGFEVVWANESDRTIWETYTRNHPHTILDRRSICEIPSGEIPEADGIIGGPPCQSWSEAGCMKGLQDARGQLFFEFIRVLQAKCPKFFVAENVPGILHGKHAIALKRIAASLENAGYILEIRLVDAVEHGVPQNRKRVFFVGLRKDLPYKLAFPPPSHEHMTLEQAIGGMPSATPSRNRKASKGLAVPNHEFLVDGFSSGFLSRNRVRSWNEVSYTILASGRHVPLHPGAPKMIRVFPNRFTFMPGKEELYRRLSIRECARIQTFPDDFLFYYHNILDGYKMVGNAVPVVLAKAFAEAVKTALMQPEMLRLTEAYAS